MSVKPAIVNDNFFAPLTAFAEGDSAAERDILQQVCASVAEYRKMIADASSADADVKSAATSISRAAHKAMPLLAMLKPGQCDWLKAITPEHIDTTPANQRTTLAHRLDKELEDIELRLKQRFLS